MTQPWRPPGGGGPPSAVTVGPCGPDDVVALRHAVLRPHTTVEHATFAQDSNARTAHFCARDGSGAVVCVATVWPEPPPWSSGGGPPAAVPEAVEAWRLRAMATHPQWRGRGVGAAVVRAVVDHVVSEGGSLLWCNARLGARRFYERAGLATWGEVWEEPVIGPHVVMYKRVGTRKSG